MIPEGYKLLQRIGAGTFGEVWRAEAPGGVEVAVKVIFRPIADQEVKRELDALDLIKRLRHPYLLQTQAYWLVDERLHIAMELGDGCLRDRLRECQKAGDTGIPVAELIKYFHESAEALDYLHGARVLHRDVKPENILLMKRHAKVADFGLARLLQADRASVSASGAGTPRYMAPEVWHNRVTPASDQYSLALTYMELRLGRHLKEGGNMMDWMFFHLQETPDLSAFGPDEEQVLIRALSKEADKRFPSCSAFMEDLAAAAKNSPAPVFRAPAAESKSMTVAEALPGDMFGTIAPVAKTARAAMPRPRTPPAAMETLRGTPDTSLGTPDVPSTSPGWNTEPTKSRNWLLGLLVVVLGGAGFAAAWVFLKSNGTPVPTSRQDIVSTGRDPNGKSAIEPFRLSAPDPLTLRVGQEKPIRVSITHNRISTPVVLTFENKPAGVEFTQVTSSAGEAPVVTVLSTPKAVVGAYRVLVKARAGEDAQQVEWQVRVEPYLPPYAEAATSASLIKDMHGRSFYDRIMVTPPGGKRSDFVLVPQMSSSDPPSFYIMKQKVSAEQFREFAAAHPQSVMDDAWRKGGRADGKDTNIADERHPALRVRVADAANFARWMGGELPTVQQWDKAAGRFEKDSREGPFQGAWDEKANRHIAVRRSKEGPLPVGAAEHDETAFGCRDMSGNGREWTRNVAGEGDRTVPLDKPSEEDKVILRGRSYTASAPLRFAELESGLVSGQFYHATSHHTGFRVVIEPR